MGSDTGARSSIRRTSTIRRIIRSLPYGRSRNTGQRIGTQASIFGVDNFMSQVILNLYRNLPLEYDDDLEAKCNDLKLIEETKWQFDIERLTQDGIAGIVEVGGMKRFLLLQRWFAKGFYSFSK